ncbi:unnamed protein product, partial [Closterium sp. NIES-53]
AGGAASAGGAAGVGADAGGASAVPVGSGGAARPRPYFVPLLEQLASPLPAPSPYAGPTGGLAERREPESRPASPVRAARTGRRVPRQRPPAVPGTHQMALRPSTAPQRVPLPSPLESSLPALADLYDPSFESTASSALVAELVDFAAHFHLDYAASLVTGSESASVYPPSVGGECALSTDVLEDRQEEFQCFAAALPHLVSMLLAPEGDPDAPDIPTPRSYAEAIEGPYSSQWQSALDAEMASWKSTRTYVDEVPPPRANIVSGMWIFRVKRSPGSPPIFKARYVARGFSQRQGVDYFQTFSPTPKMTTLRVLLHIAAQRDYELHSLDFSTAFLQGSMHEEIWLRRPAGFTRSTTLAALGFAPSTADPSLFLRTDTLLPPFYILVYVDDLVFATADTAGLAHVKSELQKRHTCIDLGELHSYLGLRITRDRARHTITLTQSHMVQQVLQRFEFTYSSPQATPLSTRHSLSAHPSDESVEPSGPYQELVGCLIYLMTCTRPDLAYTLSILARYVAPGRHRLEHMAAAKRVLRCLCSTSRMGLVLGGRSPVVLTGHADASWVDDLATQRSSQGYTFSLGSGSVSWRSPAPVDFDVWLDDLQLFLQCDSKDGLSLFDLTSGSSTAPAADADSTVRSQWPTRDAAARLAVRSHLSSTERAHFSQYKSAKTLYDAVVARYSSPATAALSRLMLPYLFPDLAAFATVTDLITHLRTSDTHYRAVLLAEDHFLSLCPTTLTVDLLEERLLAAETSITAVGASRGDPRTPFFEGCSLVPLLPFVASAAAVDLVGTESISAVSAPSEGAASARASGARDLEEVVGAAVVAVEVEEGVGVGVVAEVGASVAAVEVEAVVAVAGGVEETEAAAAEWYVGRQMSGGAGPCTYVLRTSDRTGEKCGGLHATQRCFGRLTDAWRAQFPDATEIPRWGDLLRSGVAIFDLDFDAILAAMYAVSISAEGDCYVCVLPDPRIEAAVLGASESAAPGTRESATLGAGKSALSGTESAQVFHTFTLDSGASRSFFRDRTTLTPLSQPVGVSLADPSGGPVLARYSTVLPCPAAPSGSLSGLYLPTFSTNLVSGTDLQDAGGDQFTPAGQRVTHCTCAQTGRHLASFTRRPGSSLYTPTTESPPVAASGQVAASSQVFAAASRSGPESAPCSFRLLSHQTLLWHHQLGQPSLPRLRGMASRVLVSGLPRSLPPLPPGPAPTCVPCVEGRQRAAPHSSEFPPTEAPLQTLHMDVWGPARVRGQGHERYFLLVVDDYSRYTTVFPLRSKGERRRVFLRPSASLLSCGGHPPTFTLPASPQQNGIAERRIGMVMDVARMSMIHAAAPHFLWPFAVQYAAHHINLQPRVSLPETSPTLGWTGKVGDASAFRVWGSRAFVRDLSADKLSSRAVPCVFLGFPPDAPGWQFYHPTSRRVLSSQDITFDESVPYYRLFPYRTAPLPPPPSPLFLAPGPPPVDPLPPQGPAPSGVSQVDAVEPVEVAVDSGASGGAEPKRAEPGGAGSGGAEPERAGPGGVAYGGAEPGAAGSGGVEPVGAGPGSPSGALSRRELPSPQELREWFARRWSCAAGAGGAAGARGSAGAGGSGAGGAAGAGTGGSSSTGGPRATSPGGARTGGTGATGPGGAPGAGAAGGAGAGGAAGVGATGGTGAGAAVSAGNSAGAGAAGGTRAGGAPRVGADAGGTGVVPAGSGGAARPRLYFVPLLEQLQLVSPLPAPSPYAGPTGGLAERREPESRPASPVRTARTSRRVPRQRPPPVLGTHAMALRPSTSSHRVPLPSPPASSLPALADSESDSLHVASPTVTRVLATVVTDPSFESTAVSALVAKIVDFAAHCRLDYAASLVAESASVCPPSVGGECALSTDVLEDRQEEFQCFATALPHLVSKLLALEGDPDAPDILTPRSYAKAIEGPYSSQWQAAMDAEMASWKSTGTYVDEVPPRGANIVSGMWIFRVKRPPGSPPVFKARYVARGFSQRQGVDYFQAFSPTPRMTTLRVLLHVAAQRDYELHSLDFSTAFLQGTLHEEIWLRRPPGFTGSFPPGTQWSLRRPVYGLRQAPREWHDTVRTTLAALGFAPSTADPSLFLRTDTLLPPFHILVYSTAHHHPDSVTHGAAGPSALRFHVFSPQATPLSTHDSLSALPSDESVEPSGPYPELVGCLITSGLGLVLGGRSPVVLTGHADASWVDDLATQRSSQGYTFSLGSSSVSWRSTRSSSVLSSSCEAEFYAGAMAAQELRWLTYLLTDLGEPPCSPPVLYVDNKAMLALCREHRLEHQTKHIALRYFLARELQQRGQLRLAYVASEANTTDIFTKALQPCDHQCFCTMLGLVPSWPYLLTS